MGCCNSRDETVKLGEKDREDSKNNKDTQPAQAGGHEGSLIARGDKLLKRCGPAELKFYQELFDDSQSDQQLVKLREFVPKFFGTEVIKGETYLVLENLLTGFEHPNILDCKIGKVTWTKDHNERKTKDQMDKAAKTTTGTLGFRISGLVVKDNSGKVTECFAKEEGFLKITAENIHEYFRKVSGNNSEVINSLHSQTKKLIRWFKKQSSKTFFTASVFYVVGKNGATQTKFIDFAHVYDAEGNHDQNVIQGLESVNHIWEGLLPES